MDGNSTNSTQGCSANELAVFSKHKGGMVLRINALLVANAILMAVIAVVGTFRHRYRHHPLIRFIYLGAATLFLPIVSYVISAIENPYNISIYTVNDIAITANCEAPVHVTLVMLWIGFVQIVGTSATAIVAGDYREGRSIAPPAVQLIQALWTSYLAYITMMSNLYPSEYLKRSLHISGYEEGITPFLVLVCSFMLLPYALSLAKLLFKYYAWYEARRSLGLGCNPRLIVGYMEQLQDGMFDHAELVSEHVPPPLVVMREETLLVEKQAHGYRLKRMNSNSLVTIDKVWQLDLGTTSQHKDLCLSFAMFKLLRCRFARYKFSEARFAKANNFICHVLLEDSDAERVFGVIAHELSFLHDYYYTSLPVSYSKRWLPIVSIAISLSSIGYCSLAITLFVLQSPDFSYPQISCHQVHCHHEYGAIYIPRSGSDLHFGRMFFDFLPLYLLVALVVLVEAREIMSYICSNWTKVALTCRYVNHTSWQQSPMIRKCVGIVLRTRCKFMVHWEDKMNQSSILVLRPSRNPVALLRHLLHLPDQKKKVPRPVKAAVVDAVRRYKRTGRQTNGATPLQLHVDNSLLWTFQGTKGVAAAMLVCHVATSILEVRSRRPDQRLSNSNHEIVATHISQYCAYLVAYCPELLPDDAAWCRSLYKAVKKDAARVLWGAGDRVSTATPEAEDQQLVKLLSEQSKHHVLKDGAELGRRLAELPGGEEVAWKALAEFWSETLVSVAAACDNIDDHAEAVARGGELVTLLWALLAHVGSVDDNTADAAATHGAPHAV